MPDDLGSQGPIRLPFQFGKAGPFVRQAQEDVALEQESPVKTVLRPSIRWPFDSEGTPC